MQQHTINDKITCILKANWIAMSPLEASERLGIAPSTVRSWSNIFMRFMSPTGTPGDRRHRVFVERDIDVFYFIKTQKENGSTQNDIAMMLEAHQLKDYADLPSAPRTVNRASVAMIPAVAADSQLDERTRSLLREMAFWKEQVDQIKQDATAERERMTSEAAAERERMANEAAADRAKVVELTGRLAAAETELDLWRAGRIKNNAT